MARPFRLQTVARLREAARDAARASLADALSAAEVVASQQRDVAARYAELTDQRRVASESADTAWLLNAGRYELVLRGDERRLADNAAAVEKEIEKRRLALAESERELRALEVLRERAQREERAEAQRREARRLDEFGSQQAHAAAASAADHD